MPEPTGRTSSRSRRLASAAEAASFVAPWLLALWSASPDTRFSEDVALVRQFGLFPVGLEGLVSTGLGCLFDALPFGSRVLRASWVAALGLAAFSWLLFRVTRAALRTFRPAGDGEGRSLDEALALSAALAATLAPPFILEGSIPGGYALGGALTLAATAVASAVFDTGKRTPLYLGALTAACLLESRWAGIASLAVVFAAAVQRRELCTKPAATGFLAVTGLALSFPLSIVIAAWVFPAAGKVPVGLLTVAPWELVPAPESAAFVTWSSVAGLLWCGVSLAGLAYGLLQQQARSIFLPFALFVLLDALFAASDRTESSRDPHAAVRLLAIAALAASAALAVRAGVSALERYRIPFARGASALVVVYGFTLTFVSAEASSAAGRERSQSVTDIYSELALATLEPSSVVLVRSESILLRLAAGRLGRGSRPDVLVVPMQLLESGGARARALSREPGLMPLVRDVLLSGRPGEYALSALADVRPLFVEPDPSWDARLHTHFVPRPFFTEFSPHPLGRSDRRLGLDEGKPALASVLAALKREPAGDPSVLGALASDLGQRALVLASLGDKEAARELIDELSAIAPESELARQLKERASRAGQGPLAVF